MNKKIIVLCISIFLISYAETYMSGKVFYNYTINLDDDRYNAFNIKRAYLTLLKKASDDVSYKITYDVGSNDGGSSHTVFLKTAMINWETGFGNFSLGMQSMNMFKTMEYTWGHRFIQKMSMDTYGFSSSADLGIGYANNFGLIKMSALVTNGSGYKRVETDKNKKISLHVLYGESKLNKNKGFNCGGSFSLEPYDVDESKTDNINVMSLFTGFSGFGFRGGLEYDIKKQSNVKSKIISFYGTYALSNKISFLARLDEVDGDTSKSGYGVQSVILGLHYIVGYGMTIAPTFRIITLEDENPDNSIIVNFEFKF